MKMPGRKVVIILVAVLLCCVVVAEITLRVGWGFGHTLLFQSSDLYEYIPQPNQDLKRFGNKIHYNEHSMRSASLSGSDSCIVLGFGDSVINGGTLTDQDSLATTLVEQALASRHLRFLNISAGSWAPDNCAAYLKEKGDFSAKLIVLFVSSHDARDSMTFEPTVDHHVSYPSRQPLSALSEVILRYILPRIREAISSSAPDSDGMMINKGGSTLNPGFSYFNSYTKEHNIPLIVCLHADFDEAAAKQYNSQGQEILQFCEANGIPVIRGLDLGESSEHYRDAVHMSEKGQKLWSKALTTTIDSLVKCN